MPYCRLYYHIIWATDKREPMILPEIEQEVHLAIERKTKSLGADMYAISGTEDHIHISVSIPPNISVSKFVGEIKGSSSFHINHLPGNEYTLDWQRGYGAVTFRKENLEQVNEYIKNQKEHHKLGSTWPSLENCDDN